ncbi:MAG: beta-galactosidase [Hoylesella saccharolytica]
MTTKRNFLSILFALLTVFTSFGAPKRGGTFVAGDKTFLLNGKPFVIKAAELHYPRIPRPYWEHRIRMCKALGMNTICLYVFWNIHEQQEGKFNFTGNNDVAAFCRLAQKHGLYVIVRPGPYVCAEWEMGGLPWWLLKKKDIRLRERDPYFMERVKVFEQQVGNQLAPLTIDKGGPIIMVQVENEYGSYGVDKEYVSQIRDIVRSSGFDKVALFQCDWASNFEKNGLDDLIWTMNFGTGANIDEQFKRLGELRPQSPKMCSEFWSGWFDKWGARHETRLAKDMVAGIDEMLTKGISFSLYMTHGGTSFGHWAGANSPGFAPDVTSYDYDAPINEYGLATPKYYELRAMMQRHNGGEQLPEVPALPMPLISIPQFTLTQFAPLEFAAGQPQTAKNPLSFEACNLGWGAMIYTTTLPEVPMPSTLTINDPHDYVQVFLDNQLIGRIDRVKNEKTLPMPAIRKGQRLSILVEAMGRINFGRAIKDHKGITDNVTLSGETDNLQWEARITDWKMLPIADDYATVRWAVDALTRVKEYIYNKTIPQDKIGYYRGYFNLKKVGDTFLNMEAFGKGQVYINGYAIGRFWNIGPQQTLYVPGCWLKKGENEVIVLDMVGPKGNPVLFAQDKPELDKLNLEKSNKHNNPGNRPDLNSKTPHAQGQFAPGNGWQRISFAQPARGRYLAIESTSAHDGGNVVSIAEIYATGNDGQRLSREPWKAFYADSENAEQGNHTADKVFDLQESTYWSTVRGASYPHLLVIDLGSVQTLRGIEYLPRAEQGAPGSIKDYCIFVY